MVQLKQNIGMVIKKRLNIVNMILITNVTLISMNGLKTSLAKKVFLYNM